MRLLSVLVASLLTAGSALAAKKTPVDRYLDFRGKAQSQNPVKLDDKLYGRLTNAKRDYSAAVLLTAMDSRYGCQLCREFQPEWDLLARSWMKGDKKGESRLIYGTLDFSDGRDTFMSVSAPPRSSCSLPGAVANYT
jgi:oligosaccharyltransferase complex subunit gamma